MRGWWFLSVCVLVYACRSAPGAGTVTPQLVERTNRAVGLMGQFDFPAAVEAFEAIHASAPEWPQGRLNLAIALMNRQQSADAEKAETLLRGLLDAEPVARRARYTLALLLMHEGRDGDALPLLKAVATENPPDGFAAYFVGQMRLAEAPAEALEWYQRAQAREPLLRSAYYGAFLASRRLNREADATAMLARFQALERHPQATVAEMKYTRMGPLADAITVDDPNAREGLTPWGVRFLPAESLVSNASATWHRGAGPRSITVADLNGDDALDVFISGALDGATPNAVLVKRGDVYVLDPSHPLAAITNVRAALWGDLDDDGLVDVVVCRPAGGTQIWRQASAGQWIDITASSGARLAKSDMVDGAVFDADHDGDLDIFLVNAAGPNELLNNDGNGRFRAIGTSSGVSGDGRASAGIAVADLDGDRDLDVIVLKQTPPHDVFLNGRVWEYRRDESAAALAAAPMSALVAGDFDANGEVELYSAGERGIERWRRDEQGTWRSDAIAPKSPSSGDVQLAIADTNGDGVLELIASSDSTWAVYEPAQGTGRWTNLTLGETGAAPPHPWTVAHVDAVAGPSIVGVGADGAAKMWKPGPGRYGYLSLRFSGRDPKSDQRRSNVSGLGARVALRVGSTWTAFDTTRFASGPGQSLQPVTIGLGGAARADFVSITWSDGVLQTELALDGGTLHTIGETQRQLSSCPVLFTWDGSRFRFVTDLLGVGGIGFFERPGVYSAPFPKESVLIPSDALVADDGRYRVKIAEPMEEVAYLDRAALVAYDLPPGWNMALDERKAVSGPEPTGTPVFYREEQQPAYAENDAGDDVTATLSAADLKAVGPTIVDPRFIGLARTYSVTVRFDRPIEQGPGKPVLLIDGWVEYPYAQTVFAAWQAGVTYDAPTLEARDDHGRWHTIARDFGYPAGMPRRMTFPLPPLPRGTTALRLRTSQEVYWDRIAIVYAESLPNAQRLELSLREARLDAVGFAQRSTGPQRTPHYDDTRRAPLADTRHPRGWYTELGRVDPLVAEEDEAVAIFGPGEEVTLAFDPPQAPPRPGWTRQLVLVARGWCKDMDLYTRDGETIEPLPGKQTAARSRLHPRYNTRYASGY